jgi:hypothetical protein
LKIVNLGNRRYAARQHLDMQRIALVCLVVAPRLLHAQQDAGAQLWRLAAATLPVPAALVQGAAATLWTPAQAGGRARAAALEVVQTPAPLRASGFFAAAALRVGRAGRLGIAYGRMSMAELVRTTLSPDPDGSPIPFYAQTARASWAQDLVGTTLGAALAVHETRLDDAARTRWTVDLAARRGVGGRLVLAFATRSFARFASDPAQDLYGGVEFRLWRGELWPGSGAAAVVTRYGITFGNGLGTDHQVGAGFELNGTLVADLLVAREGGYGTPTWRPAAGVQVLIGRYRLLLAADAGPRGLGAAYRVGLEVRAP